MSTSREAGIEPHISIDIVFVEHGYQIDYYVNGKFQGSECRDFGGNHRIKKLIKDFLAGFEKWLHEFKNEHARGPHACKCSMIQILREGCACGGI